MTSSRKTSDAVPTRSSSRLKFPASRSVPQALGSQPQPTRTRSSRTLAEPAPKAAKPTKTSLTAAASRKVVTPRDNASIESSADYVVIDLPPSQEASGSGKGRVTKTSNDADREPIKAYLRIRPASSNSTAHQPYLTVLSETSVLLSDPTPPPTAPSLRRLTSNSIPPSTYRFSHIFPDDVTQADFFKEAALPLVKDLIQGENGLIFAYGVTNSGKTYTVQGGTDAGQGGLLPRTLDVVFNSIQGKLTDIPMRPVRLTSIEVDEHANDTDGAFDIPASVSNSDMVADLLPKTTGEDHDDTKIDVDDGYEYAVWVSYVEIYNEKVYDLLSVQEPETSAMGTLQRHNSTKTNSTQGSISRSNTFSSLLSRAGAKFTTLTPSFSLTNNLSSHASSGPLASRKALALRTDATSPRGGKYVVGLREVRVRSSEEAKKVLRLGQINRRVFGTLANKQSSRSHAVFTVRLVRVRKGADISKDSSAVHTSRLSIVDLAGSERHKNTQSAGDRLKEAGSINKSLMILGQCLEIMRNNQKREGSRKASNGRPALEKGSIVPFWYSKLTELFQDFFEGDGKAAMIVNVNPHDTGIDENSHVMKFAALATEVTTNVALNKPQTAVVVNKTEKKKPARRTVSFAPDGSKEETLWEVAEEDEDEPDEPSDDLVDKLFEIIDDLRSKLYDAELRYAMAEVEIREEVSQEFEERIRVMEENFAKRRMNDDKEHEARMDEKIDMLYKAGLLAPRQHDPIEEEEEVDTSLVVDEDDEESVKEEPPSPTTMRKKAVASIPQFLEPEDAADEDEDEEPEETEAESEDTATDGEYVPATTRRSSKGKAKASEASDDGEDIVISSQNAAKPKRTPPTLPLYDVSVDEIPVVPLKKPKSPRELAADAGEEVPDSEGEVEVEVPKKKKRHLGGKAPVTEDQILEMVEASEKGPGKNGTVRRMVSLKSLKST